VWMPPGNGWRPCLRGHINHNQKEAPRLFLGRENPGAKDSRLGRPGKIPFLG